MPTPTVTVQIAGQAFKCSPLSAVDFKDAEALYVVICVAPGGSWTVLDIGEGAELSPRKDQWIPACDNQNVWVCVYPSLEPESRHDLKEVIRKQYHLPISRQP